MPIQEVLLKVLSEVRSAWRFRWYGAALAWALSLAGWIWAAYQPNVYEANARVYVDTSSVLRPILNNRIIAPDVETQLTYVRQALLGREHLERVARENDLDLGAATEAETARVLDKLRSDIQISGRDSSNTVYNISYRHTSREKAVGVVRTLLNSLVEATLGANRQGTDTAERFLDERIVEYENRLQQAEYALANFKRANAGRLPGAEGGYFERIGAETEALESAEKSLRLAQSKRDRILAQLESETPVLIGDNQRGEPPPNSLDARIRDLNADLDRLLLQYTDKHPDVISTRESLVRLEQQRSEQLRALGVTAPGQELSTLETNPIYQSLRIALNDIEVEIQGLMADVAEREAKLTALRALVDEVPEVEAELARLNRDYDVIYEQYQSMVQSRETQALTRKAADADDVDFRPIDPPQAAFDPVAPNRVLLLTAALVLGLGAGGALCWLLAQLQPVYTSASTLREASGYPVLGVVSRAWEAPQRARRRMAVMAFGGVMAALFLCFGVVAGLEVVGPGLSSLTG